MIIIGEKINGTIPVVKEAIAKKDVQFLQQRAIDQDKAGANFIDVCASVDQAIEVETMKWMLEIIQEVTEKPMAIDSPNPRVLEAVFNDCKKPGLINSVSEEGDKCEVLYPIIKGTTWEVVGLTCDNDGIPDSVQKKVDIAKSLIDKAAKYDITPDRIHIDPLVMTLSTDPMSLINFVEAVKGIKAYAPTVKITSGLSNISFGMPVRKLINMNFMTLAINAGMDSAIVDPLNRDMMGTIFATEALLGIDKGGRKYNMAYRKGKIGPVKDKK